VSGSGELERRAAMLGEFYKGYHIMGSGVYAEDPAGWTPKVTIYPPVRITLTPTVLVGAAGAFRTQSEAEEEAIRIGKEWVDHGGR
jgi:hypothetical protein